MSTSFNQEVNHSSPIVEGNNVNTRASTISNDNSPKKNLQFFVGLLIGVSLTFFTFMGSRVIGNILKHKNNLVNQTTPTITSRPNSPTPTQIVALVTPSITPISSPPVKPNPVIKKEGNKQILRDIGLGFDLTAPLDWKIETTIVSKGDSYIDEYGTKKTVLGENGGYLEIIKITKNNEWEIRFDIYNSGNCGGNGPNEEKKEDISLNILGQKASRPNLEKGEIWCPPECDNNDPRPQPIYSRIPRSYTSEQRAAMHMGNGDLFWDSWCVKDQNKPQIEFYINYISKNFTVNKVENKQIDASALKEMDTIIQSLSWL